MSYEVWGDDDDGLDGVRESYRKTLLEDGWLDDERAATLIEALERYQALFFGRLGNMEHMGTEEFRAAHLKAYLHASEVLVGLQGEPRPGDVVSGETNA